MGKHAFLYRNASSNHLLVLGLMIERKGLHRQFQDNCIKNKRVRLLVHLARLALRHNPEMLQFSFFEETKALLLKQYCQFIEVGELNFAKICRDHSVPPQE